jgi:hypothetical protein
MHRVNRIVISGITFLAAMLAAIPLPAAEAPPAGATAPSPAREQVMRMASFLAQLKEVSVTMRTGYDVVQESGQKI